MVALGAVLLLTAVAMLFMSRVHRFAATLRTSSPQGFKFLQPGLTVLAAQYLAS